MLFGGVCEPDFNPKDRMLLPLSCAVSATSTGAVASQVTGQNITKDNPLRNIFKTVVLSMANSITPTGLAPRLGYGTGPEGVLKARSLMNAFWATYPKTRAYLDLIEWVVALTGQTSDWAGRTRTCTAHSWMVTLPRVEILMSYKNDSWYWLDVVPLAPSRHTITVWVIKSGMLHSSQATTVS